jgi:CRISPR-associated exonuclease Cas4
MSPLLPLAFALAGCLLLGYALWTFRRVRRHKDDQGIPAGTLLYSDLNVPAEPLFSPRHKLAGKPDYILRQDGHLVPVELKHSHYPHPQPGHVLQLAAYCQILEDTSGEFVPYGIIVLGTEPTTIPFDPSLRYSLELTLQRMRLTLKTGRVALNHQDPHRCSHCSMRQYCDVSLGENLGS